jgi:hypothetical protein
MASLLAALLLASDPFTLLAPKITLTAADRLALERGETIARTLGGDNGQVGVFSMSRVNVTPDTLIAHARAIEDLKRSSFVTGIRRFSDPPAIEDLDELVLSPRDVEAAAACRVGSCSFKLTETEIATLREGSSPGPNRADRTQAAFRRVVLARVNAYLAGGLRQLPPIVNRGKPFCLDRVFDQLLAVTPMPDAPCTMDWLSEAVPARDRIESFLYWSQETYGASKPVVAVTHVGLIAPRHPGEPAFVIGKQIFASRYMTGGLALTAVAPDVATGTNYLVYVNRTSVDLLGGFLGPIKRAILESRLKGEVPEIISKLRTRLERDGRTR